MTYSIPGKLLLNFLRTLKQLYGNFWSTPEGFSEYYLKLDGYYYCSKQKCVMGVIRVRNKRTTEVIPINEIINDREYLRELHPVDACVIGILANNERNGIMNSNIVGWKKMNRSKDYGCSIKSEKILDISRRYTNNNNTEIVVLRSRILDQEIEIPAINLCKNQALLYALDSLQAISIGYDASECYARNIC
jgi:hypothetical protein